MLAIMVKKMLPAIKQHALQEYAIDKERPRSGELKEIAMRDGKPSESLYFAANEASSPLIIDVYGGGYIGGNVYKQAPLCARYRDALGVNAAALSYRYGPDNKFPAAIHDLYDGICALIDDESLDFDRNNIILEGHSAGAHLVLSTVLYAMTKERKLPIKAIILDYPVVDVRMKSMKSLPKLRYALSPMIFDMMYHAYFGNEDVAGTVLASPQLATDEQIRELPPMYINTCEYDSLKGPAKEFGSRASSLGVHCEVKETSGAVHGYVETCSLDTMKGSKEYPDKVKQDQYSLYEKTFSEFCSFIKNITRE